ncbi:AAA family ATPase [Boudabousia liubingyangii]|uniref:AAA family ATPase n=1 Tax=Boudabousia liubingyangii TaxID=1921764 RepID=A0A1Q5PNI2_9ACTO|nr:replication-associated recombination protein A [Boudabousia liubingyangii]OKL49097.1 AAA family ATPase [Boudabousia liubingyangii]
MDLFTPASSSEAAAQSAPLAVRMRPRDISEVVGQAHLLKAQSPLQNLFARAEAGKRPASSVILWGPAGTGKTTIAYLLARKSNWNFVELSAVSDGVAQVRQVIKQAKSELSLSGKPTILFVDEVHRFSKSQQDALLPAVENAFVTLIAATTENPVFSVINPLLSRSLMVTLEPLTEDDLKEVISHALSSERGLGGRFELESEAIDIILGAAGGDARKSLTILEAAADAAGESPVISAEHVRAVADSAGLEYGIDQHYDVISAFIKSMRGSDPDAALYYLARMLHAGEDPRFIARRIMIAASEDVGMADPTVLPLTAAALTAVQHVGMPEARIILAQAAVAVAVAPKSNAVYKGINAALELVQNGQGNDIPPYLRDARSPLQKGASYRYPHDYEHGVAPQRYLPESLGDLKLYEPTTHGFESRITSRLSKVEELRNMP